MKGSFPEVQFFQRQSSSSLLLPPLPTSQSIQVYIVFKCQREENKRERERGGRRMRENPFALECHIAVRGEEEGRTSGRIKEMQIVVVSCPYSGPQQLLCSLLSLLWWHWNVTCSSLQLKGGSPVGTDCPSNLQVHALPFWPWYLLFLFLSGAFSRCGLGRSLGDGEWRRCSLTSWSLSFPWVGDLACEYIIPQAFSFSALEEKVQKVKSAVPFSGGLRK